jgi:glycolate oxidase FAD binding subunit
MDAATAIAHWNQQRRRPLPISGAFHVYGHLYTRICGDESTIEATAAAVGGETTDDNVWDELRDMRHPFFGMPGPLWRISLPAAAPPLDLEGHVLTDWAGAQRWLVSPEPASRVAAAAVAAGGYAVRWSRSQDGRIYAATPMADPARVKVIRELRKSFDPGGILNARILPATAPAGAPIL